MTSSDQDLWQHNNRRVLMDAISVVHRRLQEYFELEISPAPQAETHDFDTAAASSLEILHSSFALSQFERDVVVLCAGVELDSQFAELVSNVSSGDATGVPTVNLALSVLHDPQFDAFSADAALRKWRLIEISGGGKFINQHLQLDERILYYLTGTNFIDTRVQAVIRPSSVLPTAIPSHRSLARDINEIIKADSSSPVVQITGYPHFEKHALVASACEEMGLNLNYLHHSDIPTNADERNALSRLWEREAVLSSAALLVDCETCDNPYLASSFLDETGGLMFVSSAEAVTLQSRSSVSLDIPHTSSAEQLDIWRRALGENAAVMNGRLEQLAWQFQMDERSIQTVSAGVSALSQIPGDPEIFAQQLWQKSRVHTRKRLNDLAQRIEPYATWEDIVLPESQKATLREVAVHVRQRAKVYEEWGFAQKASRGLGVSVLFAGPSGTGKTMAAEVLANELQLDLYRIDLSQVISKYIGETEKNLRAVFDAAEQSGAILLFDEADALFGKRSDVKDSHDRYSNIECSYLLQRMESYRGLACLTTNLKSALDSAFLRRIRFVVQFPFPDADLREQIWQKIFPQETPTRKLDLNLLARLDVAGGNIRNIAMNAAFLAAEENTVVEMRHINQAARSEYSKLEKTLGSEFSALQSNTSPK